MPVWYANKHCVEKNEHETKRGGRPRPALQTEGFVHDVQLSWCMLCFMFYVSLSLFALSLLKRLLHLPEWLNWHIYRNVINVQCPQNSKLYKQKNKWNMRAASIALMWFG